MVELGSVVERERGAVAHRASLRSGSLPPPGEAPKGTFVDGFLLPFSLVIATLRDPELRAPYVKLTAWRFLVVVILAALTCSSGRPSSRKMHHDGPVVVVHHDRAKIAVDDDAERSGVHVDVPGIHVDLDDRPGAKSQVNVLGREVPVVDEEPATSKRPPDSSAEAASFLASGWAWLLAFVAMLSGASKLATALSRTYDDWLAYGISQRAGIAPEDEKRKEPRIKVDWKWLRKKVKERIREYLVLAAGMPIVALFALVPTLGPWLFKIATIVWGWYWVGVFTAAKSDHVLVDEATAPPPEVIRRLNALAASSRWTAPLAWYGRLWTRFTRSFHSPAAAFERTPAAFLGLALARAILSLPLLYFVAKPIISVAAGRLCAEGDPHGRFALEATQPTAVEDRVAAEAAAA